MARGTTWTYKPKGPPLRIRVTIYCDWPECPKPDVASWRPRSAKVRAKLSRYTYCSRSHAQKDWRRREHEKWLDAQPPYQCAYLPCHNELWLTGEPGRPKDYCTPEHKAAAQRDRERRQPGGAVERATPPALSALQRAADAWQRAVGARIDLTRWVATHTPRPPEPLTEADLLRRFEDDKRAYPEALRRYEEAMSQHEEELRRFEADKRAYPEALRRYEEAMSRHEEELRRFEADKSRYEEELRRFTEDRRGPEEELSLLQAKEHRWRQANGDVADEVDRRRGKPVATEPAQDYSRYSRSHLLVMSRGPTLAELDKLDALEAEKAAVQPPRAPQPPQPPQPPRAPQLPRPPQPPRAPQLQELPPPEPALTLGPVEARERDRRQAQVDDLEGVAAAHTRRALELAGVLRSARALLARRAETARLRRAKVLEAEDLERRRDDPEYDA